MKYMFIIIAFLSYKGITAQPDYKSWDAFLKKHVSSTGAVDYKSIKTNKKELEAITKSFSAVTGISSWNKYEQLAFWINAYNAFTIDLIANNYPLKSIQNIEDLFTYTAT